MDMLIRKEVEALVGCVGAWLKQLTVNCVRCFEIQHGMALHSVSLLSGCV